MEEAEKVPLIPKSLEKVRFTWRLQDLMFAVVKGGAGGYFMNSNKASSERAVLVVDDDSSIRYAMSKLLGLKGFSVGEAENGKQALDAMKLMRRLPCPVVLDLAMPVMDGRGFLANRAKEPILAQVLSSSFPRDLEAPALPGVEDRLSKPDHAMTQNPKSEPRIS